MPGSIRAKEPGPAASEGLSLARNHSEHLGRRSRRHVGAVMLEDVRGECYRLKVVVGSLGKCTRRTQLLLGS